MSESGGADAKPTAPLLARGMHVGRFVVQEHVAWGGMGALYRALDPELDRVVGLKLVRAANDGAARGAVSAERLLREAKVLAKLSHPNIVPVFEAGAFGDSVFIAMEFVPGVTLREWSKGAHSIDEKIVMLKAAGAGLAAAHAADVVHRDFKPDNVIVGIDGRARVIDFGLARPASAPDPNARWADGTELAAESSQGPANERGSIDGPLTRAGLLLGTPRYMSSEQLLGLGVDARSDQFSFAVTFFEVLYGTPPFRGESWPELIQNVTGGAITFPERPTVPRRVRKILARALDPVPARRFASMEAMLDALNVDPTLRLRQVTALALGALVVAAGISVGRSKLRQRDLICVTDPAELAAVWDEPTRAAMMQAFERTGADGARASADRVAKKLDEFGSNWLDMRAEVCRATRVRKEQSEEVFRLRNNCLDRERTEARAITSMLANADLQVVQKSLAIAYGLPQLSWCADTRTLRASAGLPDDPDKRARVVEVRAKLADADSRELTGRLPEARAIAAEGVSLARATEHAPTIADALSVFGRIVSRQGDYTPAAAALSEATFLALGAGANEIVVRTAGRMTFISIDKLRRPGEARVWLGIARSALALVGTNEELELVVMRNEAMLLDDTSAHPELALPLREKVVAGYRRLYGTHPDTAIELHNLGETYSDLGDLPRARACFEETVAMAESFGGPDYGGIGATEGMLGQVLLELGETEHGESVLRHAIAICEKNGMDYWTARAVERLAASATARGLTSVALEQGERALRLLAAANSPDDLVSVAGVTAALARIRAGRDDALPLCERALAAEEKSDAIDPGKTYGWDALRCKAEALLALGRGAEAVPLLERSLSLKRRTFRGDYARAQFALARALTATHRDPARALDLGTAAQKEFAKYPFLGFELREVEAWLGGRRQL